MVEQDIVVKKLTPQYVDGMKDAIKDWHGIRPTR